MRCGAAVMWWQSNRNLGAPQVTLKGRGDSGANRSRVKSRAALVGDEEAEDVEGLIVQLLATRSYCLPGNGWLADLIQL